VIARHYTDSGFAFVVITADEGTYSNADDADREPVVQVYDLDHQDELPIPGEPEVRGRFLRSYYADALVAHAELDEDMRIHAGVRSLVVPASCLRGVVDFLNEL
jgi:hypothetical protein